MKINYVPGLALRFYPGLSRELYDAVDTYVATGCKIAIFTGTAPTEPEMWNLTNFTNYVTANADTLVYQETTQLQFSYDGFKHKRVIQRYPVDSTVITPLIAPIAQDQAEIDLGAIKTDNSLYALIYCPDKDATLNTVGNDLVLLVPNVGTGSTDFCSLSKVNFAAGESMYFRNLTISLFQGYQITDTLITEVQEDPQNPGQNINVPVDSKKSVYLNKVWGQRISEAYRDCFISRSTMLLKSYVNSSGVSKASHTSSYDYLTNYMQDFIMTPDNLSPVSYGMAFSLRKFNKTTGLWENSHLFSELDTKVYKGFLGNQSLINLIDEINTKALLGQLGSLSNLVTSGTTLTFNTTNRFCFLQNGNPVNYPVYIFNPDIPQLKALNGTTPGPQTKDIIPGLLVKYIINQSHASENLKNSITQLLIELGFDEGMVNSALKSLIPIDFDLTKYSSAYDKDQNILTIQNGTPSKLKNRYKKTIHNPTNEQMYIILPRYLNRSAIENPFVLNYKTDGFILSEWSMSSVSYPATSKVIDGEVVDNSTQRIRQQDYTAISIGVTGNGNTDLEYDLLDVIDYVDSFTAMVKIPNKF